MNAKDIPKRVFLIVWIILMLLLLLNWGLAQFNLGPFNVIAILTIAFTQMFLSILYFMHVRYNPRLVWIFVAAGFIWFFIMVDLTLSDYLTRGTMPESYRRTWQRTESPKSSP